MQGLRTAHWFWSIVMQNGARFARLTWVFSGARSDFEGPTWLVICFNKPG
jgi:hypothetical protein